MALCTFAAGRYVFVHIPNSALDVVNLTEPTCTESRRDRVRFLLRYVLCPSQRVPDVVSLPQLNVLRRSQRVPDVNLPQLDAAAQPQRLHDEVDSQPGSSSAWSVVDFAHDDSHQLDL
jgi:hypothetical protein